MMLQAEYAELVIRSIEMNNEIDQIGLEILSHEGLHCIR